MENHDNKIDSEDNQLPNPNPKIDRNNVIKLRYPSINIILVINSQLRFVVSPIVFIIGLFLIGEGESVFWGLAFIIGSPVVFILITAINESIKVVLDIEYNTRYIAQTLK
jgi:hypothetical protein